jgi:hypothetical protein
MLAPVAAPCEHVDDVRTDRGPVSEPVCEDCARAGETGWVSLRLCLTSAMPCATICGASERATPAHRSGPIGSLGAK